MNIHSIAFTMADGTELRVSVDDNGPNRAPCILLCYARQFLRIENPTAFKALLDALNFIAHRNKELNPHEYSTR